MTRIKLLTLVCVLGVSVPPLSAQMGRGPGKGARHYNPATEITVKGVVEEVMQTTGQRGWAGTHLELKTDQGVYNVHVGPSNYLAAHQITLAKGDNVEVVGSRAKVRGEDALIARQITKGSNILMLRDEQGFPKWSKSALPSK